MKTKVAMTIAKLIVTPNKPRLLKSCKVVVDFEMPISIGGAVTAIFFTTSTVDGGTYVEKDVITPLEFVVVISVV